MEFNFSNNIKGNGDWHPVFQKQDGGALKLPRLHDACGGCIFVNTGMSKPIGPDDKIKPDLDCCCPKCGSYGSTFVDDGCIDFDI